MALVWPEVMTETEAAEYLGVTARTFRRWRRTGQCFIPYTKLQGRYRYLKSELIKFLRRHTVRADDCPTDELLRIAAETDPQWVTTPKAAKLLHREESTLKKWRVRPPTDYVPHFVIDGRIFYRICDIERFLEREKARRQRKAAP